MPDYFLLGLLGHPLSHSLSPVLYTAALQFAELRGEFCLIDIAPNNFQTIFQNNLQRANSPETNDQKTISSTEKAFIQLLPKNLNGFSITIPYKEEVYKLVSNHSPEALLTGAVNTVQIGSDGTLAGHNTDLLGFKESFIDSFAIDLNNKDAFVIGAGGAAKAVIVALAQMGIAKIYVQARDAEKVNSFIAEMNAHLIHLPTKHKSLEIISADQNSFNPQQISTIINASPIGLHVQNTPTWLKEIIDKLPPHCVSFDLVYCKDKSKPAFASTTIARNLQTIDGLSMLVYQARHSFKYWTNFDIPAKVLFASLNIESLDSKTKSTLLS